MNERATLEPHKFDRSKGGDRFEEIKTRVAAELGLSSKMESGGKAHQTLEDAQWLIAEVERQRARAEKAEGEVERLRGNRNEARDVLLRVHSMINSAKVAFHEVGNADAVKKCEVNASILRRFAMASDEDIARCQDFETQAKAMGEDIRQLKAENERLKNENITLRNAAVALQELKDIDELRERVSAIESHLVL